MAAHSDLAQRYPHVVGWRAYARAAVTTVGTVVALLHQATTLWLVGSIVMMVEAGTWAVRFYAVHRGRAPHPVLGIAAGLAAYLVNAARLLTGLGLGLWWLTGQPTVMVNQQRRARAKARRALAQAEAMMRHAEHPGHTAIAADLASKASEVLGMPLGLRRAPTPESAPPAPAAEPEPQHSAVALVEVEAPVAVNMAVVNGVVTTYADGSHHFDPMGVG